MSYLIIFGLEFEKTIVIFVISAFEFVDNVLGIIVNFDKGSAFSGGPGSPFLKIWVRVRVRFIKSVLDNG